MANSAAWDQGWDLGRERGDESRARKQAFADEEHALKINDLIQRRQALVDKIPWLKAGTPEFDQAHAAL